MRLVPFPHSRRLWLSTLPGLVVAAVLVAAPSPARAADLETRVFSISVDGKKCGEYLLSIQRGEGDVFAVAAQSSVKVTKVGITFYEYNYRGQEIWKGTRLLSLESSSKENSKTSSVSAKLDGQTLLVKANGSESRVRADAWATSCWRLPDASFRNNTVPMLVCDSGSEMAGRLESVGAEEMTVAGVKQTCSHYRVTKDVVHDVWYDAQERLVRDEWTSNGHRTVVEMTQLKR
jgi:hypothetical protein